MPCFSLISILENNENGSGYMLAVTCSKHTAVSSQSEANTAGPRFILIPVSKHFSVSWAKEVGTVLTSGHKRGASVQANYRDSRAKETGPQI